VRVSTEARIEEEPTVEAHTTPTEVNDGSCMANLQVLVDANVAAERQLTLTGTSVLVEGQLVQPPEGKNQKVELLVENILHVGTVNAAKYPIAKAKVALCVA
jgi:asparaginyl-tRNA synthetase